MNENHQIPDEVPKHVRDQEHELDLVNSRIFGSFQENNTLAEMEAVDLIQGAEDFLYQKQLFYSEEEYVTEGRKILRELDSAIGISNEQYAHDLRNKIIAEHGVRLGVRASKE